MSSRQPPRRTPVRRRRPAPARRPRQRRKSAAGDRALGLFLAGTVLVALALAVVQWLLAHWWLLVIMGGVAAAAGAWWYQQHTRRRQWEEARSRRLRYQLAQIDALHHSQFEHAIRDLLYRDGCADAARVGGRGDLGADVIATDPSGRRWVVQCKHRQKGASGSPVGSRDLQVVNGTARPVHRADVVVVATNGRFTRDAANFATSQHIHLVNREVLGRWAGGSWPLWDLLDRIPTSRRSTPLS